MAGESVRSQGAAKLLARASPGNGELIPDEQGQPLIVLAPHAGSLNGSALSVACDEVLSKWEADGAPGPAEPAS